MKIENGKLKFLVLWKGNSNKENSWEPKGNLYNCEELVEEFKNHLKSRMESAAREATVRIAAAEID